MSAPPATALFPSPLHNKILKKKKKITYCLCFALFTFYPLISIHSNQALFPLCYWNCYCQGRLWTPSCPKQWLKFLSLYSALQWHWSRWMHSFPGSIFLTWFWETAHLAFLLPFCPSPLSFCADSSYFFPIASLYTQSWGFSLSPRPGFETHTCSTRLSSSSHHLDDTLTQMARRAFKCTPLKQNRPVDFAILPPSLLLPVWFPSW